MTKQTSKWVTIPEEDTIETVEKVSEVNEMNESWLKQVGGWLNGEINPKKKTNQNSTSEVKKESVLNLGETLAEKEDLVKHKWFWATGFVAVMLFTAALLAPDELTAQIKRLIPGNLFSGQIGEAVENYDGVNFIPQEFGDTQPLQIIPSPEGSQASEEAAAEQAVIEQAQSSQVIQAGAEAVDVMVEPASLSTQTTETTPPETQNTPATQTTEPLPVEEVVVAPAAPEPAQDEALAAQQALIQQLTQELSAFQQQSQIQAQQLSGQSPLFPAAGETPTGVETTQILGQQPGITVTQLQNGATQPTTTSLTTPPVAQATTTYRLNPYKVTVTPQQVLAQNQGKIAAAQAAGVKMEASDVYAMQANIAAANAQLGQVQATPESGPMDLMWVALALGLFVGLRTLKRRVRA